MSLRLRIIAVGTRLPAWMQDGFQDYARRLHGPWRFELTELAPARRGHGADTGRSARDAEARRMLALLSPRDYVVTLDEHGTEPDTLGLAHWLEQRAAAGEPPTFLIGGPDGLSSEVLARGQYCWALSRLTLPHGLVRVVLAEQLYRACSVLAGHPYHRA